MVYDWSYFDQIICINIDYRTDRRKKVEQFFAEHNIEAKFHTVKKSINGEIGCHNSHRDIIRGAYESGAQRILIFEADPHATESFTTENLQKCINFLKNNNWDLFNFGATPDIVHYTAEKKNDSIYRVHAYYGHCYAINREYMRVIANLEYMDIPIDIIYKHNKKTYTFFPIMVSQDSLGSDIGIPTFLSNSNFIEFTRNLFFYYYILYINKTIGTMIFYFISLMGILLFPTYYHIIISFFLTLYLFIFYKYRVSTMKSSINIFDTIKN